MYLLDLSMVRPGTVLGKTVYNPSGAVLLAEGTRLSQPVHRSAGPAWASGSIYVEDGLSDDVRPLDLVSDHVRANTAAHVARMFDIVATTAGIKAGQQPAHASTSESALARSWRARARRCLPRARACSRRSTATSSGS